MKNIKDYYLVKLIAYRRTFQFNHLKKLLEACPIVQLNSRKLNNEINLNINLEVNTKEKKNIGV